MIIKDLATSGPLPALEKMFLFAGQRQRLIAHNIANIDTPNFQGRDVDPRAFQNSLKEAIEDRRERNGGSSGKLEFGESGQVRMVGNRMVLRPETPTEGVLFHDRNHRDLERLMQDLVENATAFRVASDLMRKNHHLLRGAIAQRVM